MSPSQPQPFVDLVNSPRELLWELLFYAMTPPRRSTSPERVQELADAVLNLLDGLDVDEIILPDLDDESDRTDRRPAVPLPRDDGYRALPGRAAARMAGQHCHLLPRSESTTNAA